MNATEFVTQLLSLGTLVMQVMLLAAAALFVFSYGIGHEKLFWKNPITKIVSQNARVLAFGIAMVGIIGSMYYSEIAGYPPCTLCWYQRIFIYPQAILLAIAIIKNDKKISDYIIVLSVIAAIIAGYQYYLQQGGAGLVKCSSQLYATPCSGSYVESFGYLTIPLMSLTASIVTFVLMLLYKRNLKLRQV